ncbi:MAG: hypothetical protein OHK93_005281 [Ramalina farinacea]|uniref:Uncharacterized protein n=1 Tax=Ramalina farinacea TaxID=258253 RepID=A0AA43QVR2_9LECA|nr:hypothetical protein [Ramalina farinacea]
MTSSNQPAQRARAKTDPELSLPSLDLRMPKRRKTITAMDSFDREKSTTDQYHVKVELAEAPVVPPPMITDHTHITSGFVEHAISYAKSRLQRDITPRIATLLRDYLDLAEKVKARHDSTDKVCLYQCHKTLHSEAFLTRKPSEEELEQRAALRELSILRYYLQYGNYVAEECNYFRHKVAALSDKNLQFLKLPWTDVQAMIEKEKKLLSEWRSNGRKDPVPKSPTQDALYNACEKSGCDYDQVIYSIWWYSQRCSLAHNGVNQMIKECRFEELGQRLFWDLQDIPSLFGADDQARIRTVLETISERYFFTITAGEAVKNEHAIQLTSAKDRAILARAEKAKARGVTGPLTIGRQRRAEQDEQRESVHESRETSTTE